MLHKIILTLIPVIQIKPTPQLPSASPKWKARHWPITKPLLTNWFSDNTQTSDNWRGNWQSLIWQPIRNIVLEHLFRCQRSRGGGLWQRLVYFQKEHFRNNCEIVGFTAHWCQTWASEMTCLSNIWSNCPICQIYFFFPSLPWGPICIYKNDQIQSKSNHPCYVHTVCSWITVISTIAQI